MKKKEYRVEGTEARRLYDHDWGFEKRANLEGADGNAFRHGEFLEGTDVVCAFMSRSKQGYSRGLTVVANAMSGVDIDRVFLEGCLVNLSYEYVHPVHGEGNEACVVTIFSKNDEDLEKGKTRLEDVVGSELLEITQ